MAEEKIPGHDNATFGRVPSKEQLFKMEFLEFAPEPMAVNRIIFVLLRGFISEEAASAESLKKAKLRITLDVEPDSGEGKEPRTYEIPLKTKAYGDYGHLSIRNANGVYTETLTSGRNDVLADVMIPGMFLETGWWTFQFEGILEDGRCLFCYKLRQWLERKYL